MSATLQHAKPKTLAPGAGEVQTLLSHTVAWKVDGNDSNGHFAIFEMTDTTGGCAPVHSHPWEETFYMLEGEIEVRVGNRQEMLIPGSVGHIPANVVHTFKVCSARARALVIIAPAMGEAFYRELGEKITSLPPDPIVMQEVFDKHGLELR
jgi:quercetin dioxygenase-like cupin family protein